MTHLSAFASQCGAIHFLGSAHKKFTGAKNFIMSNKRVECVYPFAHTFYIVNIFYKAVSGYRI